jgi:hypothetical protein
VGTTDRQGSRRVLVGAGELSRPGPHHLRARVGKAALRHDRRNTRDDRDHETDAPVALPRSARADSPSSSLTSGRRSST